MKNRVSKLSDHKIKPGLVVTPLNDAFGNKLSLNSWSINRLPEYIWLALIHSYYGRSEGLNKSLTIIFEVTQKAININRPKLSLIFKLNKKDRENVYRIISKNINPDILSPLTILYRQNDFSLFNKYFYNRKISANNRIKKLKEIISNYQFHQSKEATDIRFLAISMDLFAGKLKIMDGLNNSIEALKKYPHTSHEDDKMRLYRSIVRNIESVDIRDDTYNRDFCKNFGKELGMMTDCELKYLEFAKEEFDTNEIINDIRKALEYVVINNKNAKLFESKFEVIVGSAVYSYKMFKEVVDGNLGNKILGRHVLRTITEVYVVLKYLLKKENEKPNVWEEYQYYGIGKYKSVLLKARENLSSEEKEKHHLLVPLIDSIVNEKKWEEFINIDLRYFDELSIREKFIYVNEKVLYDLYYEYETSFTHGLWGAIRESSMLFCDNPTHITHSVPDIDDKQNISSVDKSCIKIINKTMNLINDIYKFPDWYINKYEDMDEKNEKSN